MRSWEEKNKVTCYIIPVYDLSNRTSVVCVCSVCPHRFWVDICTRSWMGCPPPPLQHSACWLKLPFLTSVLQMNIQLEALAALCCSFLPLEMKATLLMACGFQISVVHEGLESSCALLSPLFGSCPKALRCLSLVSCPLATSWFAAAWFSPASAAEQSRLVVNRDGIPGISPLPWSSCPLRTARWCSGFYPRAVSEP